MAFATDRRFSPWRISWPVRATPRGAGRRSRVGDAWGCWGRPGFLLPPAELARRHRQAADLRQLGLALPPPGHPQRARRRAELALEGAAAPPLGAADQIAHEVEARAAAGAANPVALDAVELLADMAVRQAFLEGRDRKKKGAGRLANGCLKHLVSSGVRMAGCRRECPPGSIARPFGLLLDGLRAPCRRLRQSS